MSRRGVSRRRFLRGMLGGAAVTVGLPYLEIFLDGNGAALASGAPLPQRFGLFFWGNGVLPDRWVPTGEGRDWALSEQLQPLAPVKDDITVISGMELKVPNTIPHHSGAAAILTGRELVVKSHEDQTFGSPSIDQVIADQIGGATRFRSIEYGAQAEQGQSFNGPDNRNPAESSPFRLFERIFGAGFREPGDDAPVDPSIGLRRSVLDFVADDIQRFQRDIGAADRTRLEQHLEGVRALELRLARLEEDPPDLASCARPDEPAEEYPFIDGRPQISEANRAMCDIVSMALACDQTRVFSNFITSPLNNLLIAGANAGHHQLTHDEPNGQPQVNAIVKHLMGELRYMIESLKAVPEGDGTLLDSCAVLATSDVSWGRTHSLDEFPIVLAGTACGRLKNGIHYRSPFNENANMVLNSLVRAMGIVTPGMGEDGSFIEDSLSAIEV